jgi:hypothetical protein
VDLRQSQVDLTRRRLNGEGEETESFYDLTPEQLAKLSQPWCCYSKGKDSADEPAFNGKEAGSGEAKT